MSPLHYRCCLAELFTEGNAPFDLTQLLAYRAGDYYPTKVLDKIDDPRVKVSILEFSVFVFISFF